MEILNHSLWLMFSYQSIGFFIYVVYLHFQEKSVTRLLYGFFMLALGVTGFLVHIHLYDHNPVLFILFPLVFAVSLILTPLFYLHQKSLLVEDFQLRSIDLKHFVPAFVIFILLTPFWVLITTNHVEYLDSVYGLFLLKNLPGRQTWLIEILIKSLISLQIVVYFIYTVKQYKKFNKKLPQNSCAEVKIYLNGIQVFAVSFIILMILFLSHKFMHESGISISSTLFISSLLILNIGLAYFGVRFDDNHLYKCQLENSKSESPAAVQKIEIKENTEDEITKYQSSCLCENTKEELLTSLLLLMKEREPFVDAKLKLDDVSDMLNTNTKYLSQVINERFGKNFHAFLNDYRCSKVIALFHDPDYEEYSLEGIASTCGFNSRSSFVASFKKYTGKLPSEYRSKLLVKTQKIKSKDR